MYYVENTIAPGTGGNDQYVGFMNVTSNDNSCTLTESPKVERQNATKQCRLRDSRYVAA